MRVLTVVGARPQFVKAVVVSRAIEEFNQTGFRRAHGGSAGTYQTTL
jgi:UDP-N-acetylglucosamine 2-epimerase